MIVLYVDGAPGGLRKSPSLAIRRGEVSNRVPVVTIGGRHETSDWYVQPTDNLLEHGFLNGVTFPGNIANATIADFRGLFDSRRWTTFCDRDWDIISNAYRLDDYDNDFGWMLADAATDAVTKHTSFCPGFCGPARTFIDYTKATGELYFAAYIQSIGCVSVPPHTISEAYLVQNWPRTIAGRPHPFPWPTKGDLTAAKLFARFARDFVHVGVPTSNGEWRPYDAINKPVATILGETARFDMVYPRHSLCTLWDGLQLPDVVGAACPTVSPMVSVLTPGPNHVKCLGIIVFFLLACAGSIYLVTSTISYDDKK